MNSSLLSLKQTMFLPILFVNVNLRMNVKVRKSSFVIDVIFHVLNVFPDINTSYRENSSDHIPRQKLTG